MHTAGLRVALRLVAHDPEWRPWLSTLPGMHWQPLCPLPASYTSGAWQPSGEHSVLPLCTCPPRFAPHRSLRLSKTLRLYAHVARHAGNWSLTQCSPAAHVFFNAAERHAPDILYTAVRSFLWLADGSRCRRWKVDTSCVANRF